jgi:hypothetical protein
LLLWLERFVGRQRSAPGSRSEIQGRFVIRGLLRCGTLREASALHRTPDRIGTGAQLGRDLRLRVLRQLRRAGCDVGSDRARQQRWPATFTWTAAVACATGAAFGSAGVDVSAAPAPASRRIHIRWRPNAARVSAGAAWSAGSVQTPATASASAALTAAATSSAIAPLFDQPRSTTAPITRSKATNESAAKITRNRTIYQSDESAV